MTTGTEVRTRIEAALRQLRLEAGHTLGRFGGGMQGWGYRLREGHPDETADGPRLADRVRSELGLTVHRLGVPHPHVFAVGHDIYLHGDVAHIDDVTAIVEAAQAVVGVSEVHSYLRVGLMPGETGAAVHHDNPGATGS